jgi:hypothetical protein
VSLLVAGDALEHLLRHPVVDLVAISRRFEIEGTRLVLGGEVAVEPLRVHGT